MPGPDALDVLAPTPIDCESSFLEWRRHVELSKAREEEGRVRQAVELLSLSLAEIDALLLEVDARLEETEHATTLCASVRQSGTTLSEKCSTLITERDELTSLASALNTRLAHFTSLEHVADTLVHHSHTLGLSSTYARTTSRGDNRGSTTSLTNINNNNDDNDDDDDDDTSTITTTVAAKSSDLLSILLDVARALTFLRTRPHLLDVASHVARAKQLQARATALVRFRIQTVLQRAQGAARDASHPHTSASTSTASSSNGGKQDGVSKTTTATSTTLSVLMQARFRSILEVHAGAMLAGLEASLDDPEIGSEYTNLLRDLQSSYSTVRWELVERPFGEALRRCLANAQRRGSDPPSGPDTLVSYERAKARRTPTPKSHPPPHLPHPHSHPIPRWGTRSKPPRSPPLSSRAMQVPVPGSYRCTCPGPWDSPRTHWWRRGI